jgi:hypothetical protein
MIGILFVRIGGIERVSGSFKIMNSAVSESCLAVCGDPVSVELIVDQVLTSEWLDWKEFLK